MDFLIYKMHAVRGLNGRKKVEGEGLMLGEG
jgi:hypothetical protein